jgi:ThiJ/PfpI family-like
VYGRRPSGCTVGNNAASSHDRSDLQAQIQGVHEREARGSRWPASCLTQPGWGVSPNAVAGSGLRRHRGRGPGGCLSGAGHEVVFAAEHGGRPPSADPLLLSGVLMGRLGAHAEPISFYRQFQLCTTFTRPRAWAQVRTAEFDAVIPPRAHAPGMRQYLASAVAHRFASMLTSTHRRLRNPSHHGEVGQDGAQAIAQTTPDWTPEAVWPANQTSGRHRHAVVA